MKCSRTFAAAVCGVCLMLVFGASSLSAQITFSDFSDVSQMTLNGSAAQATNANGQKVLRLTRDGVPHVSGTAWFTTQQNVASGFTSVFHFQITHDPHNGPGPADGIAFVIQNSSSGTAARGGAGGAIGYGVPDPGFDAANGGHAIPNSLAVEFDTFLNSWDPDANHVAVQSCGTGPNTQKHTAICPSHSAANLGLANSSQLGVNLADGQVHTAIIEYDPPSTPSVAGTLRVFVDNTAVPKLTVSVNLATLLSLTGGQTAFVGFTGATGSLTENNDILSWTFTPAAAETSITQPLNTTGEDPSTDSVFGSYNYKISQYFTTDSDLLTVIAIPESQAQFATELNGQFPGAQCLVYDGTGGLCVKFQVICKTGANDCTGLNYEVTQNFNNNNEGNPTIVGAGMLKRQIPTGPGDFPTWSNIIDSFSQSRFTDPGGKGKSNGFSEFILCENCTAPPRITSSPANGAIVASPVTVTFSCTPDPNAPNVTIPADAGCTATLNGSPVSSGALVTLAVGSSNTLVVSASDSVGNTASQTATFTIGQAPAITSANSTTFQVGSAGSFTVTATGSPTPTITQAGTLPSGVTFSGSSLVGTPAAGTGGVYPISFTATNILGTVTQNFTLTVNQAPAITSANNTTFQLGTANSFTVTTTGFPTSSIGASSVPGGINFLDNGNGTGTLSGTPTATGAFAITFTAQNGVNPNATQNFTLNVTGPQISISPTTLNFGNQPLLSLTTKIITIKSVGSTSLQINKIFETLIQSDWDDFTFVNLCPSTLAPGKSCTIAVVYFADDVGLRTSTLNISDNAPGSPQQVSLLGTGVKKGH